MKTTVTVLLMVYQFYETLSRHLDHNIYFLIILNGLLIIGHFKLNCTHCIQNQKHKNNNNYNNVSRESNVMYEKKY